MILYIILVATNFAHVLSFSGASNGLLLMTMRGVAPPSVSMAHIFVAVAPYVVMSLILLTAVFFIPTIATWLPKLIG